MFELDVVWKFGMPWPALFSRGSQNLEDFGNLVQICKQNAKFILNSERVKIIATNY